MIFNKINLYLAKNFLKNFLTIALGFWIIFFLVNLIDIFNRINDAQVGIKLMFILSFLKTPNNLSSIVVSIVLISSIYTLFQMSNRTEITVIRNCGYSLWQIANPLIISAIFLAIIWIIFFNLFEIWSSNKYNNFEAKYLQTEMRETLDIGNGVWFKQKNLINDSENIIIVTRKIYKNSLDLFEVSMWFFDKNNNFYKRVDAKKMVLNGGKWMIKKAIVNNENSINQMVESIQIPTEIDENFLKNKIVNNFENAESFNIFELPKIIDNLKKSGLNPKKLQTHLHSKLNYIILFVAMVLFSVFFGVNDVRNRKSNIKLLIGIIFGLIIFLSSSIFSTLGASGLLSIFESTWLISFIYLAISILFIRHKEIRL